MRPQGGRMTRSRTLAWLALSVALGMSLAGCSQQQGPGTQAPAVESLPTVAATETQGVEATPSLPTVGATSGVPPTAAIPPTPRLELHASDPTAVNLASGGPTLVEFFAFW